MPCDSSYLDPNHFEREMSKVYALLDEIVDGKLNRYQYSGYHSKVYGMRISREEADRRVNQLCSILSNTPDVSQYSLEMQTWWRDHKEADRKRLADEIKATADDEDRKAALAKLTDHERRLLGL